MKKTEKEVKVAIGNMELFDIKMLTEFQGELKTLSEENYIKLRKNILEEDFSAPLFVWQKDKTNYILDGHQRARTLLRMRDDGWTIPKIPCVVINAKNEKQAKQKLLTYCSQFGEMSNDGLYEYMSKNNIEFKEINEMFRFPEIDLEKFEVNFFKEKEIKEKEVDENIKVNSECPKCGYKWS